MVLTTERERKYLKGVLEGVKDSRVAVHHSALHLPHEDQDVIEDVLQRMEDFPLQHLIGAIQKGVEKVI